MNGLVGGPGPHLNPAVVCVMYSSVLCKQEQKLEQKQNQKNGSSFAD